MRGATCKSVKVLRANPSFNPRPCARGDVQIGKSIKSEPKFQSTPLCEGRHLDAMQKRRIQDVSIHAPVRGATRPKRCCIGYKMGFNPRPCARGDYFSGGNLQNYIKFQSTPLCEGRQIIWIPWSSYKPFQSTPLCEGRRGQKHDNA